MPNCNTSDLQNFIPNVNQPWDKLKIKHLYKRLGFDINKAQIDVVLNQTPAILIDNLFDQTVALGIMPSPSWADMTYSEYNDPDNEIPLQHDEVYLHFVDDMLSNGLRGRFTLFWHNHFVTKLEDYWCPSWLVNYYQTLQTYAFGNFKDFVRAIGTTPAMLVFLNADENTAEEPNENYARELLELFTLGVNNGYTQADIVNIARAFTGYTGYTDYCAPINFNENDFDNGVKTIFGEIGNWGYDDVIDILFQKRGTQIATYICTKLYKYFISPEINETTISELANTFVANNYELLPVYKQLFKSNHFFDVNAIDAIVKSPFDLFMNFINTTNFGLEDQVKNELIWFNGELGQYIFDPTDVAGWQGNHDWINSSTIIGRWNGIESYLWNIWDNQTELLRIFAISLSSITETDPALITQNIVDHFIGKGLLTPEEYTIATDVFKDQVPQNYYDNNLWNLSWETAPYQVLVLLLHISKLPSFQLK